MATLKLLALACLTSLQVSAHSQTETRNTIFGDEKLEGEIFEKIDELRDIGVYNDDPYANNPYRLRGETKPIHYNVFWNINIAALTYSGTVEIELVANQPGVHEIVIHSDHTTINSVQLTLKGDDTIIPTLYNIEPVYHFLRIRPNIDLAYRPNNPIVYVLTITFNAPLRQEMNGLYRSWFKNDFNDTEPSWMATTHFQATGARFAFPCYDEPSLKATFSVTIRRPTTHRSWFLTRRMTSVPVGTDAVDDIYYDTPIMPTYLLCVIVADYASLEVIENGTLTYEVIARPAAIENGQGQYALEAGQELLAAMSEHTDYDFYSIHPYLKMTQASIPDFSAGAMENWGLLIYREAYIMYDEQHTNGNAKQLIAYILSHEIAHMWFGNLVTCDWWDNFWLNEGFARYYQYFLTDWVKEYLGLGIRFIPEQVHTALLSDSVNAHPLTNPGVADPVEIRTMFSTISYNKGAAIIRMTEHLLGSQVHTQGLRRYLRNRQFATAVPMDLFNALEEAAIAQNALTQYGSDFSFIDYYLSWTLQPGHPVLNVHVNHQTGDMTITQRRFNVNTGYAANNLQYIVPITFSSASNPDFLNTKPSHILSNTVTVVNRGSVGDEWVVFNRQQTGFYRVNYDDYTWDLIALALRGTDRTVIHEYNRAQIVNDVFMFARSGLITYRRAFNILSFLENETSYTPWVAAMTGFTWVRNRLAGTTVLTQLEAMIARWATTVMTDLGYFEPANEDFMRSYLRYQLAPIMCQMNVQACQTAATSLFRGLVDNGIEVPADSRNWVYCQGLRAGNPQDFQFMWQRFEQHHVYTEKILLLQTLGCTTDAASLNTFMSAIVENNFLIRPQDYTTAWNSAVSSNEVNTQIAFTFIQNNLETVINAFGGAATPLSYISSRLRSETEASLFQGWAARNREALGTAFNAVFSGAETARESMRFGAQISPDISEYLLNGNDNLSTTTSTTQPPVEVVTEARPALPDIVNPEFPNSAAASVISMTIMVVACLVINIFV